MTKNRQLGQNELDFQIFVSNEKQLIKILLLLPAQLGLSEDLAAKIKQCENATYWFSKNYRQRTYWNNETAIKNSMSLYHDSTKYESSAHLDSKIYKLISENLQIVKISHNYKLLLQWKLIENNSERCQRILRARLVSSSIPKKLWSHFETGEIIICRNIFTKADKFSSFKSICKNQCENFLTAIKFQ